ncbi:hypothetical protein PMAYCL1PPCAC_33125 [Pristionchus mayeri]|uniref:CWH43-like N-terminal domain-containing protein n=1 Tax=Pristionchus mayeri TaxID=1317129 RepID=A0AAN5DHE5_9BILA|nr:hypothetical protein PMAYCL1PPCAC_33125 [Pristionchus mayeri]
MYYTFSEIIFRMGIFTVSPVQFPAKVPSSYLSVGPLIFFVAFLPALTCYFCIGSTLILQRDIISNYSLSNCPHVKSALPPISYSIGVWEPQKFVWIIALMLHLPSRLLFTMTIPQIYLPGLGQYILYTSGTIEALGLICVSVFNVDSIIGFHAHAGFFVIWWAAAMVSMGIIIHLQRLIGHNHSSSYVLRMWRLKIGIMATFFAASAGCSIFYPISQNYCSVTAFTIFCLCEYSVVGLNAAYWGVYLSEFGRLYDGFEITAVKLDKSTSDEPGTRPKSQSGSQILEISR